jgi:phage portal protein BeeE
MKLFGYEVTLRKAAPLGLGPAWQPGWFPIIHEPFTGAWQRNQELGQTLLTSYHAVFACVTLIASDISKLRVKFIREKNGVWLEDKSPAYDPVLRRPNKMQNSVQYWENYILSKLLRGNTYVLKGRDQRGVVTSLYVLDPTRVRPLVAENGDIFYELWSDNLSGITAYAEGALTGISPYDPKRGDDARIIAPASEIIHDRMNCLYHPLCGISPLYAAGLAATQGMAIQRESIRFFENRAIPGGVLSAPGRISEVTVKHLKDQWEANFGGANSGKIAVLGDGMKFEPMAVTATDAQMLEQAKITAEWVCSVFHVPAYKIGAAPTPAYNNIQALNVEYYSQCLQVLIEAAEICLDQGLAMGPTVGVEFDLEGLLRMDTASQITSLREAAQAGLLAPNEGRKRLGLPPVSGGDSPMVQQQYFSLEALAERDSNEPFAKPTPPAEPPPAEPQEAKEDDDAGSPQQGAKQRVADQIVRRALRAAA